MWSCPAPGAWAGCRDPPRARHFRAPRPTRCLRSPRGESQSSSRIREGRLDSSKRRPEQSDAGLIDYYRRRAAEYEAIYAKPERQADLAFLKKEIPRRLRGARVLEVASGTGYWTERVARCAAKVVAPAAPNAPLPITPPTPYPQAVVSFELADAYALEPQLG